MEFSQDKIKDAFDKADPKVRDILMDTWITEDISLIGKKLGLRIDKVDILIRIIGYVILNLIPLSKLIDVIEKETGLDKEKSTELTEKIDKFIFTKIREKIKESNEENKEGVLETNSLGEPDGVRDSLIKDIENYDEEFSELDEGQSFTDMFNKNKTKVVEKKKVDIYREQF